ncbi:MAG: cell wall metabolism sensor histidine kinase WalK [Gammaproteobacteria bacterium]|nr:cell wall metabolism sensor histidine kinase WalK [Gammaproteobacteria bacterium]
MFRSKLLWQVYAGYVTIVIISTLIVGILNSRQISEEGMRDIHQSLSAHTELLAEIAKLSLQPNNVDFKSLQQTLKQLGKNTRSRLTIIANDGIVLADSREHPEKMDNHSQRPEIIDARTQGSSTTSRYSQTLKQKMIYRALRIDQDQKPLGFVRVSLPLNRIDHRLAQSRLAVLFGAGISGIAALLIGFYFARRFTDPLIKMTENAEAIAQGDYHRRITIKQQNEIGSLAKAFNSMARNSSQRMEEITADRNRYATIFAGMVEGVISIDEHQKIIHINRTAAELLELSATQCINKSIWEELRITEISQALEQAMAKKNVVKTQMRRSTEHLDQVVDIHIAVLCDNADHSIGAVIVLNDISELDHLMRIRQDFVANASHELKSPITVIRGLTETILDDDEMDPATQHRFIEKIHNQSHRLSSLVSDLLTISRLESNQDEQHFQSINYLNIIKKSIKAIEVSCQEKELSVTINLPKKNIHLLGDEQGISQLVDNLLDNAVKYTPLGGSLLIQLEVHELTSTLRIQDSGVGISPQYQHRIFERFYRVDKARSRELGGTGLGLSIVKNIAEQHGGSVSVTSQPGQGAIFTVELPLEAH